MGRGGHRVGVDGKRFLVNGSERQLGGRVGIGKRVFLCGGLDREGRSFWRVLKFWSVFG